MDPHDVELIQRLMDRLERLSADSRYAHRASGLRGSLLHYMALLEQSAQISQEERTMLEQSIQSGFTILEQAAKELGAVKQYG